MKHQNEIHIVIPLYGMRTLQIMFNKRVVVLRTVMHVEAKCCFFLKQNM